MNDQLKIGHTKGGQTERVGSVSRKNFLFPADGQKEKERERERTKMGAETEHTSSRFQDRQSTGPVLRTVCSSYEFNYKVANRKIVPDPSHCASLIDQLPCLSQQSHCEGGRERQSSENNRNALHISADGSGRK